MSIQISVKHKNNIQYNNINIHKSTNTDSFLFLYEMCEFAKVEIKTYAMAVLNKKRFSKII